MTLNSGSKVVLGIVIYTAGKFHIRGPSLLSTFLLFPSKKKKHIKQTLSKYKNPVLNF